MSPLSAVVAHNTLPDLIVFVVAGAVVIGGALGVVTSRNPVHAALSLVATLFGVAVLFIEQDANFLAAVQVIVYAGAIVVLFLFVIMFLGVDRTESIAADPLKGQRPLAIVLSVIALGGIVALGAKAHWVTGAHTVTFPTTGPRGDVGQLGKSVFTVYLFAFEATAALLVIAVVGAVVLARRPPPGTGELDDTEVAALEGDDGAGDGPADAGPGEGPVGTSATTPDPGAAIGPGVPGSPADDLPLDQPPLDEPRPDEPRPDEPQLTPASEEVVR